MTVSDAENTQPFMSYSDEGPAKKESFLTLESFVLYKTIGSTQSYEIFPVPKAVFLSDQPSGLDPRTVIVLADVPFPLGVPHPKNALTTLYGFRDTLEELQKQFRFARAEKMGSIKVVFRVPVRSIIMGTTDLEKLATTDFLNIRRLQSSLTDIIIDRVNNLLVEESRIKGISSPPPFIKISEVCSRPDLMCDVIRSESIFRHIKAVTYLIPDESNSARVRQVATVFTDQVEKPSFRGDMPFDIVLPSIYN